ncbi:hypothetical protein LUZ60_010753 [Juncus effusus]|nr:hypothetical protein LUZ60_010753 [Juncus effusus]
MQTITKKNKLILSKKKMRTLLIMLIFFAPLILSTFTGVRTDLTRAGSNQKLNTTELIHHAMIRDKFRHTNLYSNSPSITSPVRKDSSFGEYLMTLSIGTPALKYPAIADTGSDLIWTQCQPCKSCFEQSTTFYDPSKSSTVGIIPCNSHTYLNLCTGNYPPPLCNCTYNYTYGTGWTSGTLDTEKFTFNQVQIPNITFGCSTSSDKRYFSGSSGLVGLGRGPLSLISQLGATKFSYRLTSFFDIKSTSPLFIGPVATLPGNGMKSTSFVNNRNHYYLSLKGISIGNMALLIPSSSFALKSDGSGGFIIDSGTTYTSLQIEAYRQVRKAISSLVKNLPTTVGQFDLCYQLQSGMPPPSLPNMVLHFNGADMELPDSNYMIMDGNLWCLAMTASGNLMSILGNYQQQNKHILYDVANEMLSFMSALCDKL